MRYLISFIVIMLIPMFIISCKPSKKNIDLDDFLKIEEEILSSDLTPNSEKSIIEKYGYSVEQYKDYEKKLESDPGLKAKAGNLRLQKMRETKKIK